MRDKEPNSPIPIDVPSMDILFTAFQEANKARAYNKQDSERKTISLPINQDEEEKVASLSPLPKERAPNHPANMSFFMRTPTKPKETLQKMVVGGDQDKLQEQYNIATKHKSQEGRLMMKSTYPYGKEKLLRRKRRNVMPHLDKKKNLAQSQRQLTLKINYEFV